MSDSAVAPSNSSAPALAEPLPWRDACAVIFGTSALSWSVIALICHALIA